MSNSSNIAYCVGTAASDKKARDIMILNVGDISPIAEYFVICSGSSTVQVKAIADEIEDKMQEKGIELNHKEGYQGARWVLLDYGNIIAHIFHHDDREFYGLERLWADAESIIL